MQLGEIDLPKFGWKLSHRKYNFNKFDDLATIIDDINNHIIKELPTVRRLPPAKQLAELNRLFELLYKFIFEGCGLHFSLARSCQNIKAKYGCSDPMRLCDEMGLALNELHPNEAVIFLFLDFRLAQFIEDLFKETLNVEAALRGETPALKDAATKLVKMGLRYAGLILRDPAIFPSINGKCYQNEGVLTRLELLAKNQVIPAPHPEKGYLGGIEIKAHPSPSDVIDVTKKKFEPAIKAEYLVIREFELGINDVADAINEDMENEEADDITPMELSLNTLLRNQLLILKKAFKEEFLYRAQVLVELYYKSYLEASFPPSKKLKTVADYITNHLLPLFQQYSVAGAGLKAIKKELFYALFMCDKKLKYKQPLLSVAFIDQEGISPHSVLVRGDMKESKESETKTGNGHLGVLCDLSPLASLSTAPTSTASFASPVHFSQSGSDREIPSEDPIEGETKSRSDEQKQTFSALEGVTSSLPSVQALVSVTQTNSPAHAGLAQQMGVERDREQSAVLPPLSPSPVIQNG